MFLGTNYAFSAFSFVFHCTKLATAVQFILCWLMCKSWNSLFSVEYLFVLWVLMNVCYTGMPSCLTSYIFFFPLPYWLQTLTSSGSKKGELFLADINTQLKHNNITTDVKVDTSSNVSPLPQFTLGFKNLLMFG